MILLADGHKIFSPDKEFIANVVLLCMQTS